MTELRTERLLLRRWQQSDLEPWAAMNADPRVREHLGEVMTREQSDESVARFQEEFDARGYGWFAVEVGQTGEFIGFAGLDEVDEEMPFDGVEIGWRLARAAWGHGYATEAGLALARWAFDQGIEQVIALVRPANARAEAMMRRLGMQWVGETEKYHSLRLRQYRLRPSDLAPTA